MSEHKLSTFYKKQKFGIFLVKEISKIMIQTWNKIVVMKLCRFVSGMMSLSASFSAVALF